MESCNHAAGEAGASSVLRPLSWLDRLLAVWILLAMLLGVLIGNFSNANAVLDKAKFVDVSVPVAVGLIVMLWPILCRVSYSAIRDLFKGKQIWWHLLLSLVLNWIVAPLFMLGMGWAFLPDRRSLREGLILVGVARCIAMVLIWTDIASGDAHYAALLVAVNSLLQMVLYAPLAILFINHIGSDDSLSVSYGIIARSVGAFLGIPLAAAIVTRMLFLTILRKPEFFKRVVLPIINPLSLIALLFTIIVIFAAQGKQVVASITDVLRVAAPLIVYFITIFGLTLGVCIRFGFSYALSTAQAFTAASNNFELAISVAVASFGVDSQQALSSTVGPLIEVPVMLALAHLLVRYRRFRKWDLPSNDPSLPLAREAPPLRPYVLDEPPGGKLL